MKYLVLAFLLIASPVHALNLTQSCLAFYKLDEDEASKGVADETGQNSGVGVRNTNLYHTAGKVLGALDFDGADDVIDGQSDFIGATALTICAWINPTGWGENNLGFVVGNDRVILRIVLANTLFQFSSDNFTLAASANSSISLGAWQFISVTRTAAGVANLYVNGVLSGTADQSSGTPSAGNNVLIGNSSAGTRTFDGLIDNVMIFDKVLTLQEIVALYNGGRGLNSLSTLETEVVRGIKR